MSFTPDFKPYSGIGKLRFWCQKVLPLVYDDSLSYYELLNKVVYYLNHVIDDLGNCEDNILALRDAFEELQAYVNHAIENVDNEIEVVVDQMIEDGNFIPIFINALSTLIAPEYNTSDYYTPQNYVIHDGKLYYCLENTTGQWDESKWSETLVGDQLANRVTILPEYSGPTDIDSVVNYLLSVYWLYTKNANEISTCSVSYTSGQTGYFDTYAFTVICKFSSNDNGVGLMISHSPKYCCMFRRVEGVNEIYPLGTLSADNISYSLSDTYGNNTIGKRLDSAIIHLPPYTGATDINSVVSYLTSVYWTNTKASNDIAFCSMNYESGQQQGYFGTDSFGVFCRFSSNNYGSGIMTSPSSKFCCAFRVYNGTAEVYPIGNLTGENIAYNDSESYSSGTIGLALKTLTALFNGRFEYGSASAIDFNTFSVGCRIFNTSATNKPINGYGIVLGLTAQAGTWKFQIALYTNGRVFTRVNTGSGWDSWGELTRTAV